MSQENSARRGAYHRANRVLCTATLAFILSFLAACDSGGSSNPPPVVPPPPPAAAIPGDANALLKDAIRDVDVGDSYTAAEVSIDSNGVEIIRTKLEIAFRNDARLGEVNSLLATLNAQVTTSLAGVPGVVIRIPDPGSLAALDTIVGQIESSPIVWFVQRAELPVTNALPVNYNPASPDPEHLKKLGHHIGVRGPAAWNLVARAESTPAVLVMDWFGNGSPNGDLAYQYLGDAAADFANVTPPHEHGYHVLGIISGLYGGEDTVRGLVTGLMPKPVRLSVIDKMSTPPLDANNRLLQRAAALALAETVVVSTSIGYGCNTSITCVSLDEVLKWGALWATKVRAMGLEDRVLHLTSAGNIEPPHIDVNDAQYNSRYSTAAIRQDLVDADGLPIARLQNTLAIENVIVDSTIPFADPCLSSGSFHGGHLAGVGSGVWSFTDAETTANYKSGTSMATPQVAGLAAYLLAIDPTLSPQEVISILQSTARVTPAVQEDECSTHPAPAPLIDAYAAVLALDSDSALGGAGLPAARMRGELLDRDHDGAFDEDDLQQILLQLDMGTGIRDYGPWDLNGDGLTGADGRDTFDLDIDRMLDATSVEIDIEGVATRFDEYALTDYDIVCFYAYTPLYSGDESLRSSMLTPYRELGLCGTRTDIVVTVDFPSAVVALTETPLTLTVRDGNGDPLPDLLIELNATGGTVTDSTGVTDAAGVFQTAATLADESPQISIAITLRDPDTGIVVYQLTVSAVQFVPIELSVTVLPQLLEPGVPSAVQIQTLPDHVLELTVMNNSGTLGATTGTSDSNGYFETTITNAPGYGCVRFFVRAYQTQGGPQLAEREVLLAVYRPHGAGGYLEPRMLLSPPTNETNSIGLQGRLHHQFDSQCMDPSPPLDLPPGITWDISRSSGAGFVQGSSHAEVVLDGSCGDGSLESGKQTATTDLSLLVNWPNDFSSLQLQVSARAKALLEGTTFAYQCFGTGNRESKSDVSYIGSFVIAADANVTFSTSFLRVGGTSKSGAIVRLTRNFPIGTVPDYVACARLAPDGLTIDCQAGVPVSLNGTLPAGQYWISATGTTRFDNPSNVPPEIELSFLLNTSP